MQDGPLLPPNQDKTGETKTTQHPPVKSPIAAADSHPVTAQAAELFQQNKPSDAMRTLAQDEVVHPISPEGKFAGELGLAPYRLKMHRKDGQVDESRSKQETEIAIKDRERTASKKLSRLTEYDWSQDAETQQFMPVAEQIIRASLKKKLEAMGLFEEAANVDQLVPHYVKQITDDPYHYGVISADSGLILVKPYVSGYPLMTVSFAAHEMSHASTGITTDFINGDQVFITGLDRVNMQGEREGALLENALAELDFADAYTDLKKQPILHRETQQRKKMVEGNSAEKIREAKAKGENYEAELRSKVLAAQKLGIPTDILEAHADMVGRLDQVVFMWKLCRIIGSRLPGGTAEQRQDASYLFQQGRNFIERSRYAGSTEAQEAIRAIFGTSAEAIIQSTDHPDSLDDILAIVKAKEQELNLPGIQNHEPEDFKLY